VVHFLPSIPPKTTVGLAAYPVYLSANVVPTSGKRSTIWRKPVGRGSREWKEARVVEVRIAEKKMRQARGRQDNR
jgi:hypothetical protein